MVLYGNERESNESVWNNTANDARIACWETCEALLPRCMASSMLLILVSE